MDIETVRKLLPVINRNPTSFPNKVLETAAFLDPESFRKMRDFLLVKGTKVLGEVKTTPPWSKGTSGGDGVDCYPEGVNDEG